MKIDRVKISNILGIEHLEFHAGKFVEVSGRNEQGKTSVLEAIKAATQGGHDATLLRKGAEKGEVVLVMDNGMEITKRVTANASPLKVVENGATAKKPTEVLKTITDMLSVNPVDFLRAPKKDRVRVLLETMPLEADAAKLTEISGVKVQPQPGVHALSVIDLVRKQVYDDRTGTNRAVKEKESTINQLRISLPDAPGGVEGDENSLQKQIDEATQAYQAEMDRIRTKLEGIQAASQTKVDTIKADAQAKIDAIRQEAQAAIDAEQASLENIRSKAGQQRELTINRFTESTAPMNQALAVIRANRDNAAKRIQALETITAMEAELKDLKEDAARQNKAIDDIDAYKTKLLSNLPIPGLEVVDGELVRDGIPFDRLNTAQQVTIAVEIAKLRAGDLAVCCVDQLELLDTATFEAFRDKAVESGLQLFVTRVKDEDFAVNTNTDEQI